MRATVLTRVRDSIVFFGGFLRHPLATGAVFPSSSPVAKHLLRVGRINAGSSVVEFGPGTGSCTSHILDRIGPEGTFIGIDTNKRFVEMLRERFPQATFIHDGAQNSPDHIQALGISPVDAVICGLPFATIPDPLQNQIIAAAQAILKPNGTFTSYQYCLSLPMRGSRRFRSICDRTFTDCRRRVVWRNVPPAVVVRGFKNSIHTYQ